MFERYTERARRVIFFARYEASQFGSITIETQHLLLGLMREDKNLTTRFLRNSSTIESIRKEIETRTTIREKVSTSIDLPLTDECKRILAYAMEETERFGHRYLGTEHLLLGILREASCLAARLLTEAGLELEPLREELAKSVVDRGSSPEIDLPPTDRAPLHALVDQLPEQVLSQVKWMMDRFISPSKMPPGMLGMLVSNVQMANLQRDAAGKMKEGRVSSTRQEEGTIVVETHQLLEGHQISTTERYRMSDDGKGLSYSHEVVGPKPEQQHKHTMEFDLP